MKAQDLIDKRNGVDPKQVWADIRAKQKEQKRKSKKALQRVSRLGRYLVKYWKAIAFCSTIITIITMSKGFEADLLNPIVLLEKIFNVIGQGAQAISMLLVWFIVFSVFFSSAWVAWFSPREKTFDNIWLKHLGRVHKEMAKPEELTWEQHFEDLATEMTKRALKDDEYKALLESSGKFTTKLIKRLFNLDQMRIEARQYYISYYIPMLEAHIEEDKKEETKDEEIITSTPKVGSSDVHATNRNNDSTISNGS